MKKSFGLAPLLALALLALAVPALTAPLDTAFTYQGELRDAGVLANGLYDLEVRLFDASTNGAESAPLVTLNDVPVADGKFTVALNFGSGAFAGSARYLQLAVRAGASVGPYTIVLPRQLLRATPEALHANVSDIAPWAGLTGIPTGFSDGVDNDSGGTVKSVAAGTGLTGGTITNTGTLSIDGTVVQLRVTGTCAGGQAISAIASNGTVTCAAGGGGGTGTVTQVTAGSGLSGGSITTSGTIAIATKGITTAMLGDNVVGSGQINANQVQRRISGTCSAGRYFRGVATDGNIMCELLPGVHSITDVDGPAPKSGQWLSMVLGSDGLPVIAETQGTNGSYALRITHCNDLACSGGDETSTNIDNSISTGLYPSIAIGSDGYPVISYLTEANADLWVAKCSTVACTGAVTRTQVDSPGLFDSTSIAIGTDQLPVIAYKSGFGSSYLTIAKCNDTACAGGGETITGQSQITGTNNGGYARLVIGVDGLPLIAHKNYALDSVKVTHCINAACSGAGAITSLVEDTANSLGTSLNIVIRGDGTPFLSYLDQTAGTVRLYSCFNVACTSGAFDVALSDNGQAISGYYGLAMLFGADGLPVFAFRNSITDTLRFAHCDSSICAGAKATYATLDDPPGSVQSVAMVIAPDNTPIVAYQDSTFGILKVVKCGNRSCQ